MMRGIDSRNELDPSRLLRDTRTLGQRIFDFCGKPVNLAILLSVMAASTYFLPEAAFFLFVSGLGLFWYGPLSLAAGRAHQGF